MSVSIAMQIAAVRHARHLQAVADLTDTAAAMDQAIKTLEFLQRHRQLAVALMTIEKEAPVLEQLIALWPDLALVIRERAVDEGLIDPDAEDVD